MISLSGVIIARWSINPNFSKERRETAYAVSLLSFRNINLKFLIPDEHVSCFGQVPAESDGKNSENNDQNCSCSHGIRQSQMRAEQKTG